MKILKWLDNHFEEIIMVVLLVLICVVMLTQVIMRRVFNSSLTWAEEFSRYCYVWTVFLSLGYTAKLGNMLRVTVVIDMLPAAIRKIIFLLCQIVVLAVFSMFAYSSIEVISKLYSMGSTSTAMELPMYLVYSITFVGFTLGAVRTLQKLFNMIVHFNDVHEDTAKEAAIKEAEAEASMAAGKD